MILIWVEKMLNTKTKLKNLLTTSLIAGVILFTLNSCGNDDNSLAPYIGSPALSMIKVEDGSFKPRITWVGGYVSVIGVNKGSSAKLDSTLVWLVQSNEDQIRFPITFGDTPVNSQNLINQFDGKPANNLIEDNSYTYWILKAAVWNKVSQYKNKVLIADEKIPQGEIKVENDTVKISSYSFSSTNQNLDVYVNITEVTTFGRLARINILPPTDENGPIISWEIIQSGVTDSKISAIGLVKAQQYIALSSVWEMWSSEQTPEGFIYGKKNVISTPLHIGQNIEGTRTFIELPAEGLSRDENYYLWIANASWDQKARTRTTNNYSYVTFKTK
jgi:hypothetical protein